MPEVCEVHSVAGEESFVCKVVTRSTQHLDELLCAFESAAGNGTHENDDRALDTVRARRDLGAS